MNDDSSDQGDRKSVKSENANSGKHGTGGGSQAEPTATVIARSEPQAPPSSTETARPNRQIGKYHAEPPNWCEITMLLAEVIGIVGLVWYCIINLKELSVFDRERQTMEQEFWDGQTNASEQLRVMQGQLDEMRVDQRAWVTTTHIGVDYQGSNFIFTVFIKNTGRTPALKTTVWVAGAFGLRSAVNFNITNGTEEYGILAPGDEMSSPPMNANITTNSLRLIDAGMDFYVCGIIRYEDISRHPHWTHYCWQAFDNFKRFDYAPEGNATDDMETNQNY